VTLEELNAAAVSEAAASLEACCASSKWVRGMLDRRPFDSVDDLLSASDRVWATTGPADWLEAFAHHPRIGDRAPSERQGSISARWSIGEQESVADAATTVQDQLAEVNREYEQRFGHIYIVCATGKTPEDMLEIARERMTNDPAVEERVAAEEQRKITQLRLLKLIGGAT
jgi:OHCU decarboxylase